MHTNSLLFKSARTLAYLTILLLALGSQMMGQSSRARIVGTVKDPQGAVVAGANVTVTNVSTGVESRAVTDHDGSYQALELPIGAYKVKVERNGFTTAETVAYTLEINQVQRIDVTLKVGTKSETVEVTGDASQVEVVNPTLGASVTSRPIVDLPLNGRNVLDLALLEPGVTPHNNDDTSAGTYNIAGSRSDSVTFVLDGGVDNNLLSNGVVYTPNPDAVQEFRILTSNYTAEYGRNSGGIVSLVTKSGSNSVHGSVFEFNRNDAFSANSYFNNKNGLPRDTLKRNQYGFAVGGPDQEGQVVLVYQLSGPEADCRPQRSGQHFHSGNARRQFFPCRAWRYGGHQRCQLSAGESLFPAQRRAGRRRESLIPAALMLWQKTILPRD